MIRPQRRGACTLLLCCALALGACATTVDDTASDTASATASDTAASTDSIATSDGDAADSADATSDSGSDDSTVEDDTTLEGGTLVDQLAPAPTVAPDGDAADLLPDLSDEMSRLSAELSEFGDADDTLERIEQIWDRIRPQIETERPDLLDGLDAIIDMTRTAVERRQPADADKALRLLGDLVDRYTNPS